MEIVRSNFTISEIRDMWNRKELIVNKNYQRSSSVWPESARSYLIDTILNGYIFPKVYFYQVFDKKRKKVVREIVDGQQRLVTILSFLQDEFSLNNRSERFQGKSFAGLDEEVQQNFLTYNVEVDIVHSAEQEDLLAMFTRMNAYTAPLNPAEKRHAAFEGNFKWFIVKLNGSVGPKFVSYEVLTPKQSIRMQDAEFLTELAIVLDKGIENKAETALHNIYKRYDKEFAQEDDFRLKISEFVQTLERDFLPLKGTFLAKSYVVHSLFCAMMQKKYGIPGADKLGIVTDGIFFADLKRTIENLSALVGAHELQDTEGEYSEYVAACMSTTHRIKQRETRTRYLAAALV